MTFPKANNSSSSISATSSELLEVIVARWEPGPPAVWKLCELEACLTTQWECFSPLQSCLSPPFPLICSTWAKNVWTPAILKEIFIVVQSWRCKSLRATAWCHAQREKTHMSDLLVKKKACAHRPGMPLSLPLSYLSSSQETHIYHIVFIIQELFCWVFYISS